MEITDKKVIWDGTVVYLAGRNFIRNSESPEWEIETDAAITNAINAIADYDGENF